ncbi:MAG: Na/Pi symporter [Bacteroidaceae bacterium]|nr:Na/Pi symporter [Bacteroidaceae bacterium]
MLIVLKLLGSIALLIYGMKVMSEALQKMAGPQLRHLLGAMTTNRFSGVATGALVTVAVQSSAATTVMTVSFVNAALLTLSQAISVIMGANIGTTLSAWIMSAGFSFNIANLVWPAFLIGIVLIQLGKHRYVGDFLFGISFLLFALGMLNQTGREMDLASNPAVVNFFASFDSGSYGTILLFLLIGAILTCIAQSSAALMAITMVLCSTGAISIFQGIALVMGENIGTTLTANLAALSANTQARRAAMAHLLFNVFGVIWVLIIFFPFVRTVCRVVGIDVTTDTVDPSRLTFALATFHTAFNVINTSLLIGFIPQLEKLVCYIIKPGKADEEDEFRLQFIRGGIMKTPEISVFQAQKEIVIFGEKMQHMFGLVKELYKTTDEQAFKKLFERIEKTEDGSDRMEQEIGKYLGDVGDAHLSDDTKEKIRAMLRQIGELESIGDSCFGLARIMRRKQENRIEFNQTQEEGVRQMFGLIDQALTRMNELLAGRREEYDITLSEEIENSINACRNRLKQENINSLDQHTYGYGSGTVFSDLISECEKTGDYIINVVESRLGTVRNGIRYRGIQIDTDSKEVTVDGKPVSFTKTEYELLKLFMMNRGVVYSREQLLQAIWPDDVVVNTRTVDVNITRIRKKIEPYADSLATRAGFGYCFQE